MHSNEEIVRHHQRARCLIALTAFALVVTACAMGPNQTTRMTGTSTSGTASSLATDDDNFYTTGASCNGWFGGCTTEWSARFQTGGRVDGPLGLRYSGKNAGAGVQFISVWNWNTWSWVGVDAFRVVATSEVRLSVALPAPSSQWAANGSLAFVKVTTIGNFTSSSADVLQMCNAPC